MIMSSDVIRKAFVISRFAEKLLPLPGVPSIKPLGFFSFFRSHKIMLLERAFVVDTLNVQIDDNPVFRVHEVGKHTVGEFRRDDLQKGN